MLCVSSLRIPVYLLQSHVPNHTSFFKITVQFVFRVINCPQTSSREVQESGVGWIHDISLWLNPFKDYNETFYQCD